MFHIEIVYSNPCDFIYGIIYGNRIENSANPFVIPFQQCLLPPCDTQVRNVDRIFEIINIGPESFQS